MFQSRFKIALFILMSAIAGTSASAPATTNRTTRNKKAIIQQFYSQQESSLFWYDTSNYRVTSLRQTILRIADSAQYYGLDRQAYHFPDNNVNTSSQNLAAKDLQFTDALLEFAYDVYEGANIDRYLSNDELSKIAASNTDSLILAWLTHTARRHDLAGCFTQLEPVDNIYVNLKMELQRQVDAGVKTNTKKLVACLNMYRWIQHFHFPKYILVNIPAAMLTVYEEEQPVMNMKVVVGKPSTRTPRFSTWCDKVILYPYWNVPSSIALKELLPVFKRSPAKVKEMNMQIIGKNGKQVDPYSLNWASFNSGYFPYTIRQCTGCDNALGVIKFNLTDPFDVYMHDTNFKPAFASVTRYFSHGCIRVERPLDLGNYLLSNKLDSNFLKACLQGQEPVPIEIDKPIPVFVVYMPVAIQNDSAIYLKDIYHLY
jgi:murein L,D-transpeptidase YcbB/YkuD